MFIVRFYFKNFASVEVEVLESFLLTEDRLDFDDPSLYFFGSASGDSPEAALQEGLKNFKSTIFEVLESIPQIELPALV